MKTDINLEQLSCFINQLYQAVYSPIGLNDVLQELANFINAPYSAFQIENQYTHELRDCLLLGYDDNAIKSYGDYYVTRDPWTIEGFKKGTINSDFIASHRIVSDKDYRNSEFYQDWGKKYGVCYAVGSGFLVNDGFVVKVSFQRHQDHCMFDESTESFLNYLRPHLKNYVQLNPVFHGQAFNENSWEASLNCINRPLWVVDRLGKLVFANKIGHQWLTKQKHLHVKNGRLLPVIKEYENQFLNAIYAIKQGQKPQDKLIKGTLINSFMIAHLGEVENFWLSPLVIKECHQPDLFMIVGREQSPNERELEALFSLTSRQSQICALLIQGESLQTIATKLNISLNTVRNTLYACFKKLGVENQSELIMRLYSGIKP